MKKLMVICVDEVGNPHGDIQINNLATEKMKKVIDMIDL